MNYKEKKQSENYHWSMISTGQQSVDHWRCFKPVINYIITEETRKKTFTASYALFDHQMAFIDRNTFSLWRSLSLFKEVFFTSSCF